MIRFGKQDKSASLYSTAWLSLHHYSFFAAFVKAFWGKPRSESLEDSSPGALLVPLPKLIFASTADKVLTA